MEFEYMTIKQASNLWGISCRRVQVLCANGRISGVNKLGNTWAIPKHASKPSDARIKSGKYIKDKESI